MKRIIQLKEAGDWYPACIGVDKLVMGECCDLFSLNYLTGEREGS